VRKPKQGKISSYGKALAKKKKKSFIRQGNKLGSKYKMKAIYKLKRKIAKILSYFTTKFMCILFLGGKLYFKTL
jgi:hypothetical protein